MKTKIETAQAVLEAIEHVQRYVVKKKNANGEVEFQSYLLWVEEDWLVILRALIEGGWLHTTPKRPPFQAFQRLMSEVGHVRTRVPKVYEMSRWWCDVQGELNWRQKLLFEEFVRLLSSHYRPTILPQEFRV